MPRRSSRIAALSAKNQPNNKFIKHRPTVFDEFPLEVIRYHIFLFLDYDSRINLNQCLPIWDRISKKMDKMSIRNHDRHIRIADISNRLNKINNTFGVDKVIGLTELFKLSILPLYFTLIQENITYRNQMISKADEFINQYNLNNIPGSIEIRKNLLSECNKLKKKIKQDMSYAPQPSYKNIKALRFV